MQFAGSFEPLIECPIKVPADASEDDGSAACRLK